MSADTNLKICVNLTERINNSVKNNAEKSDKKTVVAKVLDFDDLIPYAGEFGRYQILLCLATLPFYFFGAFTYFAQVFLTEVSPQHWCWIPELENLTDIERRNLAIPLDENSRYGFSQCRSYDVNWTDVLRSGSTISSDTATVSCQHGWEFNKTEIPYATISSELGWVCERNGYQATAQAIFFVGSICGGFVIGWISDKFGRLPGAIVSNVIGCLGGVVSIFARNFTEFLVCRFFNGIAYDNCMMMAYLIILEYIAPKYRTLVANLVFAIFFTTAVVSLPWIALACGYWKTIALATSLPLALAVLSPMILPESPRWMLSKGRVDDAISKLKEIARVNGKEIPQNVLDEYKASFTLTNEDSGKTILDVFKRPKLRNMFIQMCVTYMCCSIIFDCLVRSLGQLEFDFFVSFSLVSFTEFPSLVIVAFIMDWTGRRWLAHVAMFVSCVFCVAIPFISGLPSVICAVIARFSINISYNAAMQWAAEVLPTSVRASGLSVVHNCGFAAILLSPYIAYLNIYIYWLPMIIIAAIALGGSITILFLPETANRDMPQTFEDVEDLIRKKDFFELPIMKKNQDRRNGNLKL